MRDSLCKCPFELLYQLNRRWIEPVDQSQVVAYVVSKIDLREELPQLRLPLACDIGVGNIVLIEQLSHDLHPDPVLWMVERVLEKEDVLVLQQVASYEGEDLVVVELGECVPVRRLLGILVDLCLEAHRHEIGVTGRSVDDRDAPVQSPRKFLCRVVVQRNARFAFCLDLAKRRVHVIPLIRPCHQTARHPAARHRTDDLPAQALAVSHGPATHPLVGPGPDRRPRACTGGLFSLLFGAPSTREVDNEVRREVDELVKKRVEEGTGEIIPGVLFIDEVHLLDIEAFSFLNAAMESELAPIMMFASNRGITKVRGTEFTSPHGIPLDLLDRMLIITTRPYTRDEVRKILEIRAAEEKVKLSEEALEKLTDIGEQRTLRYAVQLLTPSHIIAKEDGRSEIMPEDVERAVKLFSDVSRSVEELERWKEKYLY